MMEEWIPRLIQREQVIIGAMYNLYALFTHISVGHLYRDFLPNKTIRKETGHANITLADLEIFKQGAQLVYIIYYIMFLMHVSREFLYV